MATVRVILDAVTDPANGGVAHAWYEYDDATLAVPRLGGDNATTRPAWVRVTRTDAGHVGETAQRTAQPGTSGSADVSALGMVCATATNPKQGNVVVVPPFTVETRWPA